MTADTLIEMKCGCLENFNKINDKRFCVGFNALSGDFKWMIIIL